jgi:phage tail sheath protein FI
MAPSYHHGARVPEDSAVPLSLPSTSTAVIGLVCTASDADPKAFPLDTPVLFTRPALALAKAGTKGTLAKSLQRIKDIVTCPVVIVRVDEGEDEAEATSNIIGTINDTGRYTGLQALLTAEQRTGVRPLILGVPGLDTKAVTTALVSITQKLGAFAYASCDNAATLVDAKGYRQGFSARELMLIWPDFTAWDLEANAEAKALTIAMALALRAKIDQDIGWHRCLSNVPVNGPMGINADVYFDHLAEGTDADILNEAGITTLIQRNGFRFWGLRTCAKDEFIFESYTRTAQVIKRTVGDGVFEYADKPMHASLVRDIVESINAKLRELTKQGFLLGGKCWFDPDLNEAGSLMAGKLALSYDYTPVPPLEDLTLRQTFTDVYVADLVAAVMTTNQA